MILELELARRVATTIKEALAPVHARLLTLEAQIRVPGPIGPSGTPGVKGLDGKDGKDGPPGAKGIDGTNGKDGAPGPPGAKGLDGKDGTKGIDGANGRDGRDGLSIQGPPGEKGADGVNAVSSLVETTPGLDPTLIAASADMLLRKELAALDAAAPPRMTKRVIRDVRGKIERVIEEPTRG
jgi:hypothetical protein